MRRIGMMSSTRHASARSSVEVSQLAVVEKSSLRDRIGLLTESRVQQVLAGLRFQQAVFLRGR
jgi:mRNA interferase MazF